MAKGKKKPRLIRSVYLRPRVAKGDQGDQLYHQHHDHEDPRVDRHDGPEDHLVIGVGVGVGLESGLGG